MTTRKLSIAGRRLPLGKTTDLRLKVSETYTGDPMEIPVRVIRAKESGPVLLLTAAIHGDEINGTGIIPNWFSPSRRRWCVVH